jgi:peptide subunit release factor 1 (eRF1)
MTSGTQTTVIFSCPKCGAFYEATQEQHPDKHFGSFKCEDCKAEVHVWSGVYDFFNWKAKTMRPAVFGEPI